MEVCEPSWASKRDVTFVKQGDSHWVLGGKVDLSDLPSRKEPEKIEDHIDWDTVGV